MTKEEFVLQLDGRDRRVGISKEEAKFAKENGLIIIYGESDDLVEFEGAIYDEIGAWDGTDFIIARKGDEIPVDEDEGTFRYAKELEALPIEKGGKFKNLFTAEWCPEDLDCSWRITTDIPHCVFQLLEDGEIFSVGIVVDVKDLN